MARFIATSKKDPEHAVEFEAENMEAAEKAAEESGLNPPYECFKNIDDLRDNFADDGIVIEKIIVEKDDFGIN